MNENAGQQHSDPLVELLRNTILRSLQERVAALEERLAIADARSEIEELVREGRDEDDEPFVEHDIPAHLLERSRHESRVVESQETPSPGVLPHGFPPPSDDPAVLVSQYLGLARDLEVVSRSTEHFESNWREFVISPGAAIRYALAVGPIVGMVVDATHPQLDADVSLVHISRSVALAALALFQSSSAERVALDEFSQWALQKLSSEAESDEFAWVLLSNLRATGMLP